MIRKTFVVLLGFATSLALVVLVAMPLGIALSEAIERLRFPEGFETVSAIVRTYGPTLCAFALMAAAIVSGWLSVAFVAVRVLGWRDAVQ